MDTDRGVEDVPFREPYSLSEASEAALEDYARVLAQAEGAEALHPREGPGRVSGVRLRAPVTALTDALRRDIEDFARGLAQGPADGGLGWS